ncbi:hypothetical protein NC653_014330 [Populus alba x Populus x berolinensis]|uniref:Uncharacterized protein n=1 Tax=Populus alba x Populus x berolinensis TaxID=444605 RepID=A0AAD6QY59_9ROSI|nr:hypothetical protein NC653_014330 [Populus alba x Populus x berolinensis]
MHTDVQRSENLALGFSTLRSIYEDIPIKVQEINLESIHFLHPGLPRVALSCHSWSFSSSVVESKKIIDLPFLEVPLIAFDDQAPLTWKVLKVLVHGFMGAWQVFNAGLNPPKIPQVNCMLSLQGSACLR